MDFKITLVVTQRKSDGAIGIEAKFNEADSTLLLQSMAYMLDTAFSGSRENAELVAATIPDVVSKYFDIKEEQLEDTDETLKESIKEELAKEDCNLHDVMKNVSELLKRKVKDGNGEGN
jgi:hypothetical protein